MSLWGAKPRYTYSALRNAQLLPVYFPGWVLRLYVERPRSDDTTVYAPVPPRILGKLAVLGTEMVYVDAERSHIPPMMWRFLVADDMLVDAFVIRDTDCRLSDRDFAVVSDWLRTDYAFHCVRDHPSHAGYPLLGGLWGARPRQLRSFVSVPWRDLMMGYRTDYVQDMQFLANAIWPLVQSHAAYCHDSVSCLNWLAAHPFPVARVGTEHLGQVFDAFGNARDEDLQILLEHRPLAQCSVASTKANNSAAKETVDSNEQTDEYFASVTESANDKEFLQNSYDADGAVPPVLDSKSSDNHADISSHRVKVLTSVSAANNSVFPHVSWPKTNSSVSYSSYVKQVQEVDYRRNMRVNRTFNVNDRS